MSVSSQLALRLLVIGLLTMVLQVAAVSQFLLLGTSADIVVLLVMAVGLLAGPMWGALTGFGMGLLIDVALVRTLGVSSLILLTIGYWVGRYREQFDPASPLTPISLAAAATAAWAVGFSIMQFLLGVDRVGMALLWQIVAQVIVNSVIALPVYALVRRLLRSCLPGDRPRRSAFTGAGLTRASRT